MPLWTTFLSHQFVFILLGHLFHQPQIHQITCNFYLFLSCPHRNLEALSDSCAKARNNRYHIFQSNNRPVQKRKKAGWPMLTTNDLCVLACSQCMVSCGLSRAPRSVTLLPFANSSFHVLHTQNTCQTLSEALPVNNLHGILTRGCYHPILTKGTQGSKSKHLCLSNS